MAESESCPPLLESSQLHLDAHRLLVSQLSRCHDPSPSRRPLWMAPPKSFGSPNLLDPPGSIPNLTDKIIRPDNWQYCAGGAFGDVFRCQYTSHDGVKEVAVKAFRFGLFVGDHDERDGGKAARMIHRELGIWRRLNHRNIVPFLGITYGFGREGSASLVSTWMPNGTLHKFLEAHQDRLLVAHRLQLLLDIANGLKYLHSFPMVHGDLSSNNVVLDHNFHACLTDFGCASLIGELPEGLTYLKASTMRPGTLRWTAPEHLSPNQEETKYTTKSDIYSFGNMALLVLSGKNPWSEIQHDALIVLNLFQGVKPARPPARPIDDQHWMLIERCWSSTTERPFVEDIVSLLQQFLSTCIPPPPLRDLLDVSIPPLSALNGPGNDSLTHQAQAQPDPEADEALPSPFPPRFVSLRVPTYDEEASPPLPLASPVARFATQTGEYGLPPVLRQFFDISTLSPNVLASPGNNDLYDNGAVRPIDGINRIALDPFAEGSHYGPILEPSIVKIVGATVKVNPLLAPPADTHDYLRWNMLFDTSNCYRTTEYGRPWVKGREAPATHPRVTHLRIISRSFPWIICARAGDPKLGVTCGDVVKAISVTMHEGIAQNEFEYLSVTRKRKVLESYRLNRSADPNVPKGRLGDMLNRLDWLGSTLLFGGLTVDDVFVKEHCGDVLPCTFELKCLPSYPLEEPWLEFIKNLSSS